MYRPPTQDVKLKDLKKVFDDKNLSYSAVARKIGYSRDYISKLMQGKRPLSNRFVTTIIKRLL